MGRLAVCGEATAMVGWDPLGEANSGSMLSFTAVDGIGVLNSGNGCRIATSARFHVLGQNPTSPRAQTRDDRFG